MRWFIGLKVDSVDSYRQLTQAFGSRFVINSRAPQPLSVLLSLSIHDGETLKTYSSRYWEMYNEMDGNFNDVAINTFKSNLPTEHGLRKSLNGKPATSVHQLMDRIDTYKRVEEDQMQGKEKEKVIHQERRDFKSDRYTNSRSGETSRGNRRQPKHKTSGLYSENQCIRCWKKSRANHTLDGRIRWRESPRSETRTFIANTTKTTNIPRRTAGIFGIIWTSWSEKES